MKLDTLINSVNITETERIIDKYSDKVGNFISQMAESLKVPAEHVYNVLIKQSYVDSFTYLIILILGLSVVYTSINILIKNSEFFEEDSSLPLYSTVLIMGILGFVASSYSICHVHNIIQGFINPEYGAIEKILEVLK